MKDNVSEYLKNSLGSIDKQRSDIISKLFESNGLVAAEDSFEFESKSENLISENRRVASGKTLSRALVRPLSSSLPILKSMFFTVS
jgi:hypothetical protein